MNTPLQPFEPDHLIRLVHAQYPHRIDVLRALRLCSGGEWENGHYIHFIGMGKSVKRQEIRIVESLLLTDENDEKIKVDVMADGRIAGVGYLTRVIQ